MTKYLNLNGRSKIEAFEIGDDYIIIKYKHCDSLLYYTYESCGINNVENMKRLAIEGRGLFAYVNEYAKNDYDDVISVSKKAKFNNFFHKIH